MLLTFQNWPKPLLITVTIVSVLLEAVLDWVTGTELRFFVFYFIPVGFAAWTLGLRWAISTSLLCTISWFFVEILSGQTYSHPGFLVGNGVIRIASYMLLGYFVFSLRQARLQLKEYSTHLEEKVAERTARLQERVSELEMFSYSVSHNLRGPLRGIEGMAHILEENAEVTGAEAEACLEKIKASAARMDRLILDLVEYVELTISEPELRGTAVAPLVREALHGLEKTIKEKEAVVTFETEMPHVIGHNRLLHSVVFHLLGNALKFVDPQTRPGIWIGASRVEGGFVRVWVRDNGIGIEEPHHERIFGLFEQLHPYDVYAGTGMGLAIAKKCIEKMNGRIGCESGPEGSKFWFELQEYQPAER